MANGIVTINTDAGFFHIDRVGSFAYWIKADDLHLKGSGMFKGKCKSPLDAELKAIINALHVLRKANHKGIKKIIFNRDNINATSRKNGSQLQNKIYLMLRELRNKSIKEGAIKGRYPFYEFRHVRAHTDKEDKRSWVNNWCDKECKIQLAKWNAANRQRKFESK